MDTEQAMKQSESDFNMIFGSDPLSATPLEMMMRATAVKIIETYPDNRHRSQALGSILCAAGHLKKSRAECRR